MRIAYVITQSDSIGGASIHVRDLAQYFNEQGNHVCVLVGGNGTFITHLEERGIPYISIPNMVRPISPVKDILAYREIRKTLLGLKPDIVTTHSSKAGVLGRLAARSLGIPVIFTAHGWAFTEGVSKTKRFLYKHIERSMSRFSDKIITVSEYDRQLALQEKVAPEEKLVTIHNGMPDISPELYADPGKEPPRIIMVARFAPPKDHATLLKALSELKHLSWDLELVGDGPLLEETKKLASDLGIAKRVNFTGATNDVPERLSKSQIFVLSTNWEGLPLTIIEAMRAGLPVIASNVGGVGELVESSNNGFLFSPRDKKALMNFLCELLLDIQKRQVMGEESRNKYERNLFFTRLSKETLSIYFETIKTSELRGKIIRRNSP
jgi:glycosyltransferase involved in cell wall biosynthesis